MYSQTTKIINVTGLHARPASEFIKMAKQFESSVLVGRKDDDNKVSAKSMIKVISLGMVKGTDIEISAEGADEETAVKSLVELIESGFGE